jgi:hypothetical protein
VDIGGSERQRYEYRKRTRGASKKGQHGEESEAAAAADGTELASCWTKREAKWSHVISI